MIKKLLVSRFLFQVVTTAIVVCVMGCMHKPKDEKPIDYKVTMYSGNTRDVWYTEEIRWLGNGSVEFVSDGKQVKVFGNVSVEEVDEKEVVK